MKHLALFLIGLILNTFSNGQILTVKDRITHQPVELAAIYSTNPKLSILTNSKGRADITSFSHSDSINVRIIGYQSYAGSYKSLQKLEFIIFLTPSDISLDEVVISASRWIQNKKDIPNRIAIIKPIETIIDNPQTAADMLGSSGEVYIQKSQLGGGSPMIRGFAANRVLITVDGVRMNNAIFRSGNLQNVISIDPYALQSTEIVFGPGAVVYGSDAIGGVMNFYTHTPLISPDSLWFLKGSTSTRYSTANNEKTGHFHFNFGNRKWSFLSSSSYSDFEDLRMGSNGPREYLRNEYVVRINGMDSVISNSNPFPVLINPA